FTRRRRRTARCRGRSPARSWCRRMIWRPSGRASRPKRASIFSNGIVFKGIADMPRWIGFLGSWALLVLALGLAAFAVAGEWINVRDIRRLNRAAMIDQMIAEKIGGKAGALRQTTAQRAEEVNALQNKVQTVEKQTDDVPDTGQTIIVSTAEN